MEELLKQGISVDSKDLNGYTAIQIAMAKKKCGHDVIDINSYDFPSTTLNEMLQIERLGTGL
ncbi:hypothetical protein CFP56_036066 [Quercus suber]|uniref:Ankyrin repeat family protein n=1 Tax=Quercus suber TaxID=58331 RepID=A0AAW0LRE5_QUESU